jgi:hypothetical protein
VAAPGIAQHKFDFSKREFDYFIGLALNYWGPLELRVSLYSYANLNRGISLATPFGFKDGVLIENRYYFHAPDRYDIGRSSFIAVGYYPAKGMIGGDGIEFRPVASARAYGAYDLPFWNSYLYLDSQLIVGRSIVYINGDPILQNSVDMRLVQFDGGLAVRPVDQLRNLEFRVGGSVTRDLGPDTTRHLAYGSVRFLY